jgi:hypothetical protein
MRTQALRVFATLAPFALAAMLPACALATAPADDGNETVNSAATSTPPRASADDPGGSTAVSAIPGAPTNGAVTPLKTAPLIPQPQPWYPAPFNTGAAGSTGTGSGSSVETGH